jgi:hypothetical protein
MNKKKGNFFEQHVDKLVFGIIGILCLGLLWVFVLSKPYIVVVGDKELGPGEVDNEIKALAERLDEKLKGNYVPRPYSVNKSEEFLAKFECSIEDVPDFSLSLPGFRDKPLEGDRKYRMPAIVDVREVEVASIRGVAYVPDEEVTPSRPYTSVSRKQEDIDFVTVEGKVDIRGLYANFNQHFEGWKVEKQEWRDNNLARPVFAAFELQRSELLENGSWSDWEVVPRTNIDPYTSLFSVSEDLEDLKYDINLLKLQFEEFAIRRSLLQPDPYEFTSGQKESKWLTPKLYKEYAKVLEEEKEKKRREEIEKRGQEGGRDRDRDSGARGARGARGGESTSGTGGSRASRGRDRTTSRSRRDRQSPAGRGMETGARGRRDLMDFGPGNRLQARKGKSLQEISRELDSLKISDRMDFESLDVLTCWAHDDTITEAGTYKYRLRLGLFNPIVGRDWFYPEEEHFKNQVILWSAYSEPTGPVEIYPMVEFFPLAVASADNDGIKIRVSKYFQGRWQSNEFDVRLGETIGRVVEPDSSSTSTAGTAMAADAMMTYMMMRPGFMSNEPVDYNTGAVLVDVVNSDRWMGRSTLQLRDYEEILYTKDGVHIEHLAMQERNWPQALRTAAKRIKDAEAEEGGVGSDIDASRMRPGEMRPDMMMDPMMMEMMRRSGGRR